MNSEQLSLGLFSEEPWDGQSPRYLTRGRKALFLRQEPQKSVSEFVDPDQYDIWPTSPERPPVIYRGAPLLVEI